MVTAERQTTSKLVALDGDSRVLGYTHTNDPKRFLRELGDSAKLAYQVRIYEVCPPVIDDVDHYYDFEATCLLQKDSREESQS
ncbi:hypothetical protein [Dongia deserti]|uniref:hypothetical protein n=1 Tax=Dongia deserti TaxID=2268030 RepID=UPI000E64A9A0|nr:hypothetical protein [Dongia deserti]